MIACGTKILAPVLSVTGINRVQWTGAACTSARRLPTSKATMRGLKPPPDWTWSHWLWLVSRRATSVVQWGPLESRFANATSVHGAVSTKTFFFFFCITGLPLSATHTVKYTTIHIDVFFFFSRTSSICRPTTNATYWKPAPCVLIQLCILPWSIVVPWSLEGGLEGGFTCFCLRFWLPSCLIVRYGSQTEPGDKRQIPKIL